MTGKIQVPVTVQTGISNDQFTEITGQTALQEGDVLAVNAPATTSPAPSGGFINLGGGARGGR